MPSSRRRRPAAGLAAVIATAAAAAGVVTSTPSAHAATLPPIVSTGSEELRTNAAAHYYYNPYGRGTPCGYVGGVYQCPQKYNQAAVAGAPSGPPPAGNHRWAANDGAPVASSGSGDRRWAANDGAPVASTGGDDRRWAANDGAPVASTGGDDRRWAANDGAPVAPAADNSVSNIPQAAPVSSPTPNADPSNGEAGSCFDKTVWDDFVIRSDAVLADFGVTAKGRAYFGAHVASMSECSGNPSRCCLTGDHPYRSMGSWAAVARYVDGDQTESVFTDDIEDLSSDDEDSGGNGMNDDGKVERVAIPVAGHATSTRRRRSRSRSVSSSAVCESRALSCESSGWTYGCTSRAGCCCPQYCDSYFVSVFAPLDIAGSAVRRSVGGCCIKSFCVG